MFSEKRYSELGPYRVVAKQSQFPGAGQPHPVPAFGALVFWILNLFRISGTTPGNRRPPLAELSSFVLRASSRPA